MARFACILILLARLPPVLWAQPGAGSPDDTRQVGWKELPANVASDQKQIWTAPAYMFKNGAWLPMLAVAAATAGLVASDPLTAPHFRNTTAFHTFNSAFSSVNTSLITAIVPASLFAVGLARKDSHATKTALFAGEALADVEILTTAFKGIDRRIRPRDLPANTKYGDTWFESKVTAASFPSGHTIAAFSVCNRDRAPLSAPPLGSLCRVWRRRRDRLFPAYSFGSFRIGCVHGRGARILDQPLRRFAAVTAWRWIIAFLALSAAIHPASAQTKTPDGPAEISLNQWLLTLDPSTVTTLPDWCGLSGMRLPLFSERAFSWTDVRYTLDGVDVTAPYQPGRMLAFPDMAATQEVVVRQGASLGASPAYGSEIVISPREPENRLHGEFSSSGTASPFASENLPSPAERGDLLRSQRFQWLTSDHAQLTGPLGRHADALISVSGQWASQSVPPATPGQDLNSRVLFLDLRMRYQLDAKNKLQAAFSSSKIRLGDWGVPAGIEALAGLRSVPPLSSPYGFSGLRENDSFTHAQVSWSRPMLEAHYGYSKGSFDSRPTADPQGPAHIDLATGMFSGPAPLANLGDRSRHSLDGAYTPAEFMFAGLRHDVAVRA